jgi:hypothetical protein
MAFSFPLSPATNDTYTVGSRTYTWTGSFWEMTGGLITTSQLTDLGVTTAKIDNLSVTAGKIASDAVATAKILDANVTAAKLASGAAVSNIGFAPAPLSAPTFTGTVVLPSTTSIGTVSSTEIGYVDGVTSAIQTQLDSKLTATTAITSNRNKIINGAMSVWQRGAGAFTTSHTYTADRWVVIGASGQTISVTQQSFTAGNAISGFEPQFHARIAWSGTPSGAFWFTQRVEDVRTFAGQQVVLSFWAKASASTSVFAPVIEQNFGTGGSGVVSVGFSAITLTTSWQRFAVTINVPSISGKTIGTNSYLDVRPLFGSSTVNGLNIDIWGVQLEAGSVATPFESEDIGTTLQKCQRYFQSYPSSRYDLYSQRSGDEVKSATLQFITTLRTTPTVTLVNTSTDGGPAFSVQAFPHCSRVSVTSTAGNQAPYIESWTASAEL